MKAVGLKELAGSNPVDGANKENDIMPKRDPKRIKPFLDKLGTIWEENCPDWRFGQLMMNVFGAMGQDPFFPEEDEMIAYFEEFFK